MSDRIVGIYVITNIATGKCYVGSSNDIEKRWSVHQHLLRKGTHHSPHLQHAYNKHGEQSFTYDVLEETVEERLIEREQFWIDQNDGALYNTLMRADRVGRALTPEARKRIGDANRGLKRSPEFTAYLVEHLAKVRGGKRSAQACRNISESLRGRVFSDATRAKLSEAQKARFAREPVSEATRLKKSENAKRIWAERRAQKAL